jgi:ABC-type transport system involved in multi-copper enzyme maturation permease subunit
VNGTLFLYTLRQRFQQPLRMVLVLAFFGFPLLMVAASRGATGLMPLSAGSALALVLGAGLIGSDSSAGVFQLLFARPVTRAGYVLSRWLAVAAAAGTLGVLQVLLGAAILVAFGHAPDAAEVGTRCADQALSALSVSSLVLLFSTVLPGIGDVVAVVLGNVASALIAPIAGFARWPWLERLGREVNRFFAPDFAWADVFGRGDVSWFLLVSWASTIALCVALAIVVMNRREISYASGG